MKKLLLFFALSALWSCKPAEPVHRHASLKPVTELVGAVDSLKSLLIGRTIDLDAVQDSLSLFLPNYDIGVDRNRDSVMAQVCFKTGDSLINNYNYPAYAIPFLKKALLIHQKDGYPDSVIQIDYYRLLVACKGENDYAEALHYAAILDTLVDDKTSEIAFKTKLRVGQIYFDKKEFYEALARLEGTYAEAQRQPSLDLWIKTDLMVYISYCYRDLGNIEKALSWGKSAEAAEKVGLKQGDTLTYDESGRIQAALANAWSDSLMHIHDKKSLTFAESFGKAIEHLHTGKACYSRGDLEEVIRISGNLGELYRRAGKLEAAEKELKGTLDTLNKNQQPQLFAQLYINLGETRFDGGRIEEALVCYDSALYFLCPSYKPGQNDGIPSPRNSNVIADRSYMPLLLADMANACFVKYEKSGRGDLVSRARGEAIYDTLQVLFNVIRSGYTTEDAKLLLAQKATEQLKQAFGWYRKLYQPTDNAMVERAFQVSEQCKAFAMIEAVRINNYPADVTEGLDKRERQLMQKLTEIENDLVRNWGNTQKQTEYKNEKQRTIDELVVLKKNIQWNAPAYFAVRYGGNALGIKEIQKKILDEGQSMVEYFVEDSVLNIFIIPKSGSPRWERKIFSCDTLISLVDRFHGLVSKLRTPEDEISAEYEAVFCNTAYRLYELLLSPLERLENRPERLVIVPDGALNNLSFEALVLNSRDSSIDTVISQKNFALFKYAVSYCFSANFLAEMKAKKSQVKLDRSVAVFAPSYVTTSIREAHPSFSWFNEKDLGSMSEMQKKQLFSIKNAVKCIPYPNISASKANFVKACQENICVQAIAHAFLDKQDPNLSCIAFTQQGAELDEDNLLLVRDLYAQKWAVELIGLSSCETARGPFRIGEGNISVARGLACAGVRSFITTLWKIPLDGPAEYMPDFYNRLLNKGMPKDIALAEAKRSFILKQSTSQKRLPTEWAGAILIGATDKIEAASPFWPFVVGGVVVIALFYFLAKRRR